MSEWLTNQRVNEKRHKMERHQDIPQTLYTYIYTLLEIRVLQGFFINTFSRCEKKNKSLKKPGFFTA
jgi:hypothetical protein